MVTAAHTLSNAWWEDPSTEAVPEVTGVQMTVPDEMAVEDDEHPLAWKEEAAMCEQWVGTAGYRPSCHSRMAGEWGNRCSFGRRVQSSVDVWRT